jgi:hypothetical protein
VIRLCAFLLLEICVCVAAAADAVPVAICAATKNSPRLPILITGTGQYTSEGLVIGDMSCPVFRLGKVVIPAAVLINIGSFGSEDTKAQFSALRPGLDSEQIRILVRGTIECQNEIHFSISDDGKDVTGGNGYGAHGFFKCHMADARLERLAFPNRSPAGR